MKGADAYDKDGSPLTLGEFVEKRKGDYHRVGLDEIDGIRVSTVWLGIDHNFIHKGPPIIFETMVFGGEQDCWQTRYCTLADAEAGHAKVVATILRGDKLPES